MDTLHAQMRMRLPAAEYEVIVAILRLMRAGRLEEGRAAELVDAVLAAHAELQELFGAALEAGRGKEAAPAGGR